MSDVAAPGWARLTGPDLGRALAASRGDEKTQAEEIFLEGLPDKRFCHGPQNLRQFTLWRPWQKGPDREGRVQEPFMSQFIERYPTAVIWLFAILQGVAMLGLNVVLRALVS
jgi:hypothetical protein